MVNSGTFNGYCGEVMEYSQLILFSIRIYLNLNLDSITLSKDLFYSIGTILYL